MRGPADFRGSYGGAIVTDAARASSMEIKVIYANDVI
jgi:hypothetical protein